MATLFSGSPHPPGVPIPPPAAHPAVLGNTQTALTADQSKSGGAAAEGMGLDDTVKTSSQGLNAPATAKTTLLG